MTTILDEIYSPELLALAAAIPHSCLLATPDGRATAHSKLCGSTVTVDVIMRDGLVADFGQDVQACLLGQAAASIVGHNVIGSSPDELRGVGAAMRAMLKENGAPPDGKWSELGLLEPVRDYRARHASTLLVFDAIDAAMAEAEAEQGGEVRQHAG